MKTKRGNREMNPTDAFRKEQRKKEIKKNKLERQRVREYSAMVKDPAKMAVEIERLETLQQQGKLDSKQIAILQGHKITYKAMLKKKEREQKQTDEEQAPAQSASASAAAPTDAASAAAKAHVANVVAAAAAATSGSGSGALTSADAAATEPAKLPAATGAPSQAAPSHVPLPPRWGPPPPGSYPGGALPPQVFQPGVPGLPPPPLRPPVGAYPYAAGYYGMPPSGMVPHGMQWPPPQPQAPAPGTPGTLGAPGKNAAARRAATQQQQQHQQQRGAFEGNPDDPLDPDYGQKIKAPRPNLQPPPPRPELPPQAQPGPAPPQLPAEIAAANAPHGATTEPAEGPLFPPSVGASVEETGEAQYGAALPASFSGAEGYGEVVGPYPEVEEYTEAIGRYPTDDSETMAVGPYPSASVGSPAAAPVLPLKAKVDVAPEMVRLMPAHLRHKRAAAGGAPAGGHAGGTRPGPDAAAVAGRGGASLVPTALRRAVPPVSVPRPKGASLPVSVVPRPAGATLLKPKLRAGGAEGAGGAAPKPPVAEKRSAADEYASFMEEMKGLL